MGAKKEVHLNPGRKLSPRVPFDADTKTVLSFRFSCGSVSLCIEQVFYCYA